MYVLINFSEVFLLPAAERIVNATLGLHEVTLHIWPLRQFFIIYDGDDIAGFVQRNGPLNMLSNSSVGYQVFQVFQTNLIVELPQP